MSETAVQCPVVERSTPAPTWQDWVTGRAAAALVLAVFLWVLLASVRDKSATFDEPGFVTAGYTYSKFGDYRLNPESGVLVQRWMALPLRWGDWHFPSQTETWTDGASLVFADQWFNRCGNDPRAMIFQARVMSALVAVALGIVIWAWSRRLFGPAGAMVSLAAYVSNPAILANGALATADVPAALGFLLSAWCISATLARVTAWRVLATTLALAGLFLAKMSAVLIVPIAALLVAIRIADGSPLPVGCIAVIRRRRHQALALGALAVFQVLAVGALVWAAYGFRYGAFSLPDREPRFQHPWEWALGLPSPAEVVQRLELSPGQAARFRSIAEAHDGARMWTSALQRDLRTFAGDGLTPEQRARFRELMDAAPDRVVTRAIWFCRRHELLPEAFLYGFAYAWRTSERRMAYLNGIVGEVGWREFFPYVFAIKTPLPLFGLLGLSVVAAAGAIRRGGDVTPARRRLWQAFEPVLPVMALAAVYVLAVVVANLNIGHRHLLPVYPALFVGCGFAGRWFDGAAAEQCGLGRDMLRVFRFAALAIVALLWLETAAAFPNYIAYFNGVVAPRDGYRHVVDSSLDWGQELPEIARFLDRCGNEPAYLAYFGTASPQRYGVKARQIAGFIGVDRGRVPVVDEADDMSPQQLGDFLREHTEYDPGLVCRVADRDPPALLFVQRSDLLRLQPGIYVISASMLPPLYHGNAVRDWNPEYERYYHYLARSVEPFLVGDASAKIAALHARPTKEWQRLFADYFDFRFSRLTAYLRQREPETILHGSVLVYRLSADDLYRALDAPRGDGT